METVRKVNEFLESHGLQLERQGDLYVLNFPVGSATISMIRIIGHEFPTLILRSALVALPNENIIGLYRYLLEKNREFLGNVCFAVEGNHVIAIETIDNITSINKKFFFEKIGYFSTICDEYDDELVSRFGAQCIR